MTKEKNPIGRPPTINGKPRQINLSDSDMVEADRIGRGNASEGIRRALKVAKSMTLAEIAQKILKNEK